MKFKKLAALTLAGGIRNVKSVIVHKKYKFIHVEL